MAMRTTIRSFLYRSGSAGSVLTLLAAATACDRLSPTAPTTVKTSTRTVASAVDFTVLSQGLPANPQRCGGVTFTRNGAAFHSGHGCAVGSARGWNVAAIDPRTGLLIGSVQNFDTWYYGARAATAMIEFVHSRPDGTLLLIAVGDEAGVTVGRSSGCSYNPMPGSTCCQWLGGEFARLRGALDALGARQMGGLCYWNSYSLIAIKGVGMRSEQLAKAADAVASYTQTLE
jgi:hypothetical protein